MRSTPRCGSPSPSADLALSYEPVEDAAAVLLIEVEWGPDEEPGDVPAAFRAAVARVVDRVWRAGGWVVRGVPELEGCVAG
jgi:hypothetical protein